MSNTSSRSCRWMTPLRTPDPKGQVAVGRISDEFSDGSARKRGSLHVARNHLDRCISPKGRSPIARGRARRIKNQATMSSLLRCDPDEPRCKAYIFYRGPPATKRLAKRF